MVPFCEPVLFPIRSSIIHEIQVNPSLRPNKYITLHMNSPTRSLLNDGIIVYMETNLYNISDIGSSLTLKHSKQVIWMQLDRFDST